MARPTKYRSDFPDRALGIMRNGASLAEVAAELGISFETLNVWRKDGKHKTLAQALDQGTTLAQVWWEKLGRAGAQNGLLIQPAVWIFTMKNRFDWTDKREVTHKEDPLAEISDEELIGMINALRSKLPTAAPVRVGTDAP